MLTGFQDIESRMETLLVQYAYWFLLPLAIVEGPIVTISASFLASQGYLQIAIVYTLVLAGDVLGDILHYVVGKYGGLNLVNRFGKLFGVNNEALSKVKERYFKENESLWGTLTWSKITHAPSSAIMFTAGLLRVNFMQFLLITSINNVFKVLFFVVLGYFFGEYYKTISIYITNSWVIFVPIFIIAIYLLYGRKK